MVGSTFGFDTSGVKIHPSLLQQYYKHQQGVNQVLRQGLHQESKQSNRQSLKVQVKKTKKKST